jgi:hypothetical protein
MSKKFNRIGIDVDEKTLQSMKDIADKERWSVRKVGYVALQNYLRLRGYRDKDMYIPK